MSGAARLYTPEILGLATALAALPFDPEMPLQGRARAASCGSTLEVSLSLAADGTMAAIGVRAQACAIGQASAALFAQSVCGRAAAGLAASEAEVAAWLQNSGPCPDWPGLDLLTPAIAFPARHGAILLPWKAALDALSRA